MPLEEKKWCFWLNIINYAILDKLLELTITDRKQLKNINSLTRFSSMFTSVKVKVNTHELTIY